MISPEKWQQLRAWMQKLNISEEDLDEKFILGSGSGGQKINKTASCVALKHSPTNIIIKCQDTRSREHNRFYARRRLCEKIEEQVLGEKSKKQQAIEKIRRQKRKRTKRVQQKILESKAHRAEVKKTRQKPKFE